MTTALYHNGDIIALKIKPEQAAGMVSKNQEIGANNVEVFRVGEESPEPLPIKDITPWHGGKHEANDK